MFRKRRGVVSVAIGIKQFCSSLLAIVFMPSSRKCFAEVALIYPLWV